MVSRICCLDFYNTKTSEMLTIVGVMHMVSKVFVGLPVAHTAFPRLAYVKETCMPNPLP